MKKNRPYKVRRKNRKGGKRGSPYIISERSTGLYKDEKKVSRNKEGKLLVSKMSKAES